MDTRDLSDELDELDETAPDERDDDRATLIQELADEIGEVSFRDGVELVREDDFEDYARQLAEDIGAVPDEYRWPTSCIDWTQAAHELSMDYTSVNFDGETYLYRD